MHIGRRRDGQRRGRRQGRSGQQIIGNAAGHLRHHVGRAGSDEEHVALLGQRNVVDGVARIVEQPHGHFLVGQRPESYRIHEMGAVLGHDHLHPHARLLQPAHDLAGLIGRNTSGHTHQNTRALHAHTNLQKMIFPLFQRACR